MKTLQQFLNQNKITNLTKEVFLSNRISDEEGNLYPFTIRTLSSEEITALRSKSLRPKGSTGDFYFDKTTFDISLVITATTEPNFKDAASIRELGYNTPEQYLESVLLPGEINRLSQLIQDFNGYSTTMDSLISQAKN